MSTTKIWLVKQFDMKDLDDVSCVVEIQIICDGKKMSIALFQYSYIDKILIRFNM